MKTLTSLSVSLLVASAALTAHAHPSKRHAPAFERALDNAMAKRDPQGPQGPQSDGFSLPIGIGGSQSESSTSTSSESTSSRTPEQPPTSTPTSTSTQAPPPPTDNSSTSTPSSTSSSTSSSSSSSSSSSRSIASSTSSDTRTVIRNTQTYASIGRTTTITTPRSTASNADQTETPDKPSFTSNKGAVAATVTVAAIVVIAALVFIAFWIKKKSNRGKMGEEDMWDEASMKDLSRPPVAGMPVTPPPIAMSLADEQTHGGLTRSRTQTQALPSQLTRQRSNHSSPGRSVDHEMEPDEILAMPPVTNYERPRDSAYDIVPAAPPTAAYASQQGYGAQHGYGAQGYDYNAYSNAYASASGSNAYASASGSGSGSGSNGGLAPPKRAGDHTSFGSGFGSDPFAGTGFVDATRESTYGPGQAGRGAGYGGASASASGSNAQVTGLGNQWPQNYDPYTGYSQGAQTAYGQGHSQAYGGYGYAS